MSDRMMTLTEARDTIEVLEGFRATHAAGLGHFETQTLTAARTIVAQAEQIACQAEQIERLQAAPHKADQDAFRESADRYGEKHD